MRPVLPIMIVFSLLLLLCKPVFAEHSGPYLGAYLGGNILMDSEAKDSQGSFNLGYNQALQWGVTFGWDLEPDSQLGEGRIELEYSRRSNPLDQVEFAEGKAGGDGDLTVDSLLLNCIGVVRNETSWLPYVIFGVGTARIDASGLKVYGKALASDTATVFAYQAGIGVDYVVSDHLDLDLGYRFFGTTTPRFSEADGSRFKANYFSHSLILGLRVGF